MENIINKIITKTLLVFLFVFFLIPGVNLVHSQSGFLTSISSTPRTHQPNENFSISLTSTEFDLNRSKISWFINGIPALSGVGKIGFLSRTAGVGTSFNIKAVIETPQGKKVEKSIFVKPQEVDLLWTAYTHTPVFFKGLPLPSSSSFISITAIPNVSGPNNKLIKPSELIYTWSQDGIVLGKASGYGKQTIVLENAQIPQRPLNVKVVVTSLEKTVSSEKNITIPLSNTEIHFYKKDSLRGVLYNESVVNTLMDESEYAMRVEPYYFSTDDVINDLLTYNWHVGREKIDTSNFLSKNEIVFRKENISGEVRVSLELRNNNLPLKILQKATKVFKLKIN